MFKIKYKLLLIVAVLSVSIVACTEENSVDTYRNNAKSLTKLNYDGAILDDPDFQEYVSQEFKVVSRLDEVAIMQFDGVEITDNNRGEALKALGFSSDSDMVQHDQNQNMRLSTVEKKFGLSEYPVDVRDEIFTDAVIHQHLVNDPALEVYLSCKWKKIACDAGVIGVAVGSHTACAAMDIATYGVTLVAGCHVGAALVQASGHLMCVGMYDDCIAEEAENN